MTHLQQNRVQSSGYPGAIEQKQRASSWISGGLSKKGGTLHQESPIGSKRPGSPGERGVPTLNPAHHGTTKHLAGLLNGPPGLT